MKVVILAAGMGTRLGKYTHSLPKGMLSFIGKPLIQWQIEAYRRAGLNDIAIVTGYCAQAINFPGVQLRHNPDYSTTNMVSSLMCARDLLDDDVLVSYADLLVSDGLISKVREFSGEIGVVVDMAWADYWYARYGRCDFDTESLILGEKGEIKSLGIQDVGVDQIHGRYVGVLRFSRAAMKNFIGAFDGLSILTDNGQWRNSKNFSNAYMTDMIQEMIDRGYRVDSIPVKNGWLEFDTESDYEICLDWHRNGQLERFISLGQ